MALWADNYDARCQLWRVAFVNYFYSQESKTFHRGTSIYHDLTAKAYQAGYLVNERGDDWWRINIPLTPAMFSPGRAARGGHGSHAPPPRPGGRTADRDLWRQGNHDKP